MQHLARDIAPDLADLAAAIAVTTGVIEKMTTTQIARAGWGWHPSRAAELNKMTENRSVLSAWRTGFTILVSAVVLLSYARASERALVPPAEDRFAIGASNVCSPVRRIVLVRNANELRAFRFEDVRLDEESDSYRASVTVMHFAGGHWVEERPQHVVEKPLRGWMHPFMFQAGNTRLRFGTFDLQFNGPACVSMYPYGREEAD